jgi:hypothetical protein
MLGSSINGRLILKYVLNVISFVSKPILIIYWDIYMFRTLAPCKVNPYFDRSASQWNGKGDFSEDTNNSVASIHQQGTRNRQSSHGL